MAPLEKSKRLSINMRYVILAFVFINIVINYMDRTNVSIAMPELSKEIGLSTVQQGIWLDLCCDANSRRNLAG